MPARDAEVEVSAGTARLAGHLTAPGQARGAVVFAPGSGSSRHSPRNRYVAAVLTQAALGTLLFDLLTPGEEADRANVFDLAVVLGATLLFEEPGTRTTAAELARDWFAGHFAPSPHPVT
ncbi:MAG TPA: hypothetical protein VMV92_27330 [Streptosporangiaceae bacterium]|nr:hypothetical protein [Streptosporangiaceae bacterium]